MLFQQYLLAVLTFGYVSSALPTTSDQNLKRSEVADGDDKVVYTWSLPEGKTKRSETSDGDDKVAYTWSLPEQKGRRAETADGDDKVVYTWSLPEDK
ncbi:hypothetical protein G7Y89_g9741 [Cudoniella acicularis]|uniref:Uncharacterized protein n=1 Tax=Cudoniella acicularis TaxID=354080 RepID=A0A8H4RFM2_9HELO|nr:hypothetical protein G7Y89_g9741 [Cudoniella acicularis]